MPKDLPAPNDDCWCNSGKKYKKCHQARDIIAALAGEKPPGILAAQPPMQPAASKRVRPGIVSPRRTVPAHIPRPDYAESGRPGGGRKQQKQPRTADELKRLRNACQAAQRVLAGLGRIIRPGMTTDEIDAICHEAYIREGGFPSTLNYHGFPKSLCTSVNEVICHGIPDSRKLEDGDIVNCDVTIYLDGMHGDCNATFPVGEIDAESKRLIETTHRCLMAGIGAVKPGGMIRDIGRAISRVAAESHLSVVRAFVGHGIGELFHMDPQVPHYYDPAATTEIKPGMTFTIEPMINQGSWQHESWSDGWTAVTIDGKRSAQFEHTILVTDVGVEILTWPADEPQPFAH